MPGDSLSSLLVSQLKGVGPRVAELLHQLDIFSVQDLLFHLPLRYEDRTRLVSIAQCKPGERVYVRAVVDKVWQSFAKRRMLLCQLREGNRKLTCRFFHFTASQAKAMNQPGKVMCCFGDVRLSQYGLEMVHPQYTLLADDDEVELSEHLTPIYPTTDGLGQATWLKLMPQALRLLERHTVDDILPAAPGSMTLQHALTLLHRPPAQMSFEQRESELNLARRRLALEELVAYQLQLKQSRAQAKQRLGYQFDNKPELMVALKKSLPFELTAAQQRVMTEIESDLFSEQPMLRLLQGDVGSGKTMVALLSVLHAVANGYQAALMAPTEILAEQHYQQCQQWLEPLGVRIAFVTGSLTAAQSREALRAIAQHQVDLVVGTHALFQQKVEYASLALLVIDEQHRFGVQQRLALVEKGKQLGRIPHQLTMTATPIPRTLAMTAYADLDYSVIDELPPGRQPIQTILCGHAQRDALIARLAGYCEQGRQAYWVCTLVEDSEALRANAAEEVSEELKRLLPNSKVGLVHGRLTAEQKQQVMQQFHQSHLDVLVATTVIEVGVNVPNATVMVIDNAERLGLSQLHQLRGRVGRGDQQSYCVLHYQAPLSVVAKQRLELMRESNDGFAIADADLKLRGAGEILGSKQSGVMGFKIADIAEDVDLVSQAHVLSDRLMNSDAAHKLLKRWGMSEKRELVSV